MLIFFIVEVIEVVWGQAETLLNFTYDLVSWKIVDLYVFTQPLVVDFKAYFQGIPLHKYKIYISK